jgi:hypothetical protein
MLDKSNASRGVAHPGGGAAQWPAQYLAKESLRSGHYTILHVFCKLPPPANEEPLATALEQ